jgi:hypothetical protein
MTNTVLDRAHDIKQQLRAEGHIKTATMEDVKKAIMVTMKFTRENTLLAGVKTLVLLGHLKNQGKGVYEIVGE